MTSSDIPSQRSAGIFFLLTFILSWMIWLPGVLVALGILPFAFNDTVYVILNVAGGSMPTLVGLLLFHRQGGGEKVKDAL